MARKKKTLENTHMIVKAGFTLPQQSKRCKQMIEDACSEYGAKASAVTASKSLWDDQLMKDIKTAKGRVPNLIALYPKVGGMTIVPLLGVQEFKDKMDALMREAETAKKKAVSDFDGLRDRSMKQTGKLADSEDYPTKAEFESSIKFSYQLIPIAEGYFGDIQDPFYAAAIIQAGEGLIEKAEHAVSKLSLEHGHKDGKFRDTLIENIRIRADIFRGMVDDAVLTEDDQETIDSILSAMDSLCKIDPDKLRTKEGSLRSDTATALKDTTSTLEETLNDCFGAALLWS